MEPTSVSQKGNRSSRMGIGAGIAIGVILLLFVPFIPISYEEKYEGMQTRQIAYQELEDKSKELFSESSYTIQPGLSYEKTAWIKSGHQVEFTVSASDYINTYIRSSDGKIITSREGVTNARYGFTAPIDDTYKFQVVNPYDGPYPYQRKSVGMYDASGTENWQELVTKFKEAEEPAIQTRQAIKNESLFQIIYGQLGPKV